MTVWHVGDPQPGRMTATCDHPGAAQVHNGAGEPVRLICPCGREWRVLPVEWEVPDTWRPHWNPDDELTDAFAVPGPAPDLSAFGPPVRIAPPPDSAGTGSADLGDEVRS